MQTAGPPPSAWSGDGIAAEPGQGGADATGASDVALCASSWKHIKTVSIRDESRSGELLELLQHSIRETHYSFQPQEWPNLLKPLPPGASELPGAVTSRYATRQTVAFCGVLPDIRRAWASVDSSLFLWRYDRWRDAPLEWTGEGQSIVTIGLVTPRPGVFVEAIQKLLVICTTVEVLLVGVCSSDGGDGAFDELTLQALPLYSVPVDDEPMVCVAGTADGRVFLGGADGELHELLYNAPGSGWRSKPLQRVCHTRGVRRLLPGFLPAFVRGTPSPLVDLVVDEERHLLYGRTQRSKILAFDLGADGAAAPSKVAECTDPVSEGSRALGGREAFGQALGVDRRGAEIVLLAPIPASESSRLHLLLLTQDARRIYFSVSAPPSGPAAPHPRPSRLRAEVARTAPPAPLPRAAAAVPGAAVLVAPRALEVTAASYSGGVLLLADAAGGQAGGTRLLALTRDHTQLPVGTALGAYTTLPALRETLVELEGGLAGDPCAVAPSRGAAPTVPPAPTPRDELMAQNLSPAPRFVVVTTGGVMEVERQRPADVLAALLIGSHHRALEHFFRAYGPAEAAAMCVLLACGGNEALGAGGRGAAAQAARLALEDPRLCGETAVRDARPPDTFTTQQGYARRYDAGGFDMGAAVPVAEPVWSGAHQGLCLYAARVLGPTLWNGPLVAHPRGQPALLRSAIDIDDLGKLERRLRLLAGFVQEVRSKRAQRGRGLAAVALLANASTGALLAPDAERAAARARFDEAVAQEERQTDALAALVDRAAQATFLLRVLAEHNLGRLAASRGPELRSELLALCFRDWVVGDGGAHIAASLIAALVAEHLTTSGGLADDLAAALASGCPAFFGDHDRVYYRGVGVLRRAEAAREPEVRAELVAEAVALLRRVPRSLDLVRLTPQLVALGAAPAAIELAIVRARAVDPGGEGGAARDEAYLPLACMLRALLGAGGAQIAETLGAVTDRPAAAATLVAAATASPDPALRRAIYRELMAAEAEGQLLALGACDLEGYLITEAGLAGATPGTRLELGSAAQRRHVEVLARLYVARKEHGNAAQVLDFLADAAAAPGAPRDTAPTLERREQLLRAGVLQARSCGDADLVERLEAKARVVDLQARVAEALERKGGAATRGAAADLRTRLCALAELYNDYAVPNELWGLCLEAVDLSGYSDEAYVRHLWDLTLREAWQDGWDAAVGAGGPPAGPESCASAALAAAAERAADLGARFFPNENSLPLAHLALRLAQVAAGAWPAETGLEAASPPAAATLVTACKGAYLPALRAYEELLSPRGAVAGGAEGVRTVFLREVLWLLELGRSRLAGHGSALLTSRRPELGALVEAGGAAARAARSAAAGASIELVAAIESTLASITAEHDGGADAF